MIVVMADDLSGAAELAGAAWRHGLSAELQTTFTAGTDAEVICVATDTRSLPADQAARRVAAVTQDILAAQPAWIFKKCDSVLRGPVLAEARAMARSAGKSRIVILSANPSRGRIIRNGTYFIQGRPLHETTFANDPEHPRTTSSVALLLGGDLTGVATPDAESSADVLGQAAAIDDATLPVGAADFFVALLELRMPSRVGARPPAVEPAGPTLLVCGSAAAWAQRRTEAAALGVPVFALLHDIGAVIQALSTNRGALIGIGEGPATTGHSPAALATLLAQSVAGVFRGTKIKRLLLEGGATTGAVLQALGWTRLRACAGSAEGVGVLQPAGSRGPRLFIKPGSYPWPPEIWP